VYGLVPPEVVAVKVTGLPGVIVVGLKVKSVVSASGLIVIVAEAEAVTALALVTLSLTVKVPFTV
jgi:hypothetical protein